VSKTTLEEKKAGLKEKGILLTIQRSAILEFLQDNTHHPTADEIYQSLRRIYPALSRATVYNTLDLFNHFFCRQCGGIYDVGLEGVPLEPGGWLNGHKMEEARLYMTGTCAVCLGKERDAGAP
jgi:Fur family peroxide stress response transcriptional regulator